MCLVIDDTLIWDNRIDQKMSKYKKNAPNSRAPLAHQYTLQIHDNNAK